MRIWGEGNPVLGGVSAATTETNVKASQKTKSRTSYDPARLLPGRCPKNVFYFRYLHAYIYPCSFYNSKEMESAEITGLNF